MKKLLSILILLFIMILPLLIRAQVSVKIKNLVNIEGLNENSLIGYGIVSGLNGTGDSNKFKLTQEILKTILFNLGLDVSEEKFYSKNIALVLLTAKLPPNIKNGEKINVRVSSIGDAKSINGGVLLQASLKGLDNKIYAVAQGAISVIDEKKNLTSGIVPNSGTMISDFTSEFIKNNKLILSLKDPDFNTAVKIRDAILEFSTALDIVILNDRIIEITITEEMQKDLPKLISDIHDLEVQPQSKARIVIDKNTGVVVFSGDIRLNESGISYKNLDIKIGGLTKEEQQNVFHLESCSDVQSLVNGLNKLGARTDDIISILYSLKSSGALYADIKIE